MKTSFILVLCFALAYCADWRKFQEGTHTTIALLEERLKSLEKHTQELVNKPEKEGIDVVKANVKDELGHLSELEKSVKEELTKNHTLISQNFFLEKTVVTINLIRAELNQLEKILEDIEKKIGSTFAFYAATEPPIDYREKYDHLLMESINERLRFGENFLETVSHQVLEFQRTHNEELHQTLLRHINFALPMIQGIEHHFEEELKKTGLNTIERFTIEKAKAECLLLIKALTEIYDIVKVHTMPENPKKAPVFFAPTEAPNNWRQAYDELLFAFINQHIQRADADLLILQREIKEYQKSKDKELKDKILNQVNREIPMLKTTQEHAVRELQRTDLNHIERFLYEKSRDQTEILIKHFTQIQTEMNKAVFVRSAEEFFAPTEAPADWRQAYDQLLFAFINQHIQRADADLLILQREIKEYQKSKDKELKDKILNQVNREIPMLKTTQEHAVRELQRTDLNHIERFLYEKSRDQTEILIKHFTQIQTEMNKAVFVRSAEEFFAPTEAPTDWRQAYDQLLFSFVEQHIRRADEKLLNMQRELKEYQTTKNKELHDRIVSETEREITLLKGTQQQVANELKRTDLDHIERYLYEKSKDEAELLIKHYTQIQTSIKALVVVVRSAEVYFAPTATPGADWRQAYDELLFAFINQHIQRADADLLILQREIKEYQKSKDKELKDKILNQVNREIPMLKTTQEHAVRELQRTDLNNIERFLYEKSRDQTEILIKHFTQIQTEINKAVVVRSAEEFFAPTEAPTDWRQAYDQLLFSFINEHIQRADYGLLRLQREFKEYQTTKNKELKDKIVREVETEISLLKATQEHAVRELQRTDLDNVERFLYEKSRDQTGLLIKHYTQVETAIKSATFFRFF